MNASLPSLCLVLAGQPGRVPWEVFSSTDWDLLARTARAHGVAPLLYHVLETGDWPAQSPAHLRRDLWLAYHATAARNLLLYRELSRILALLSPEAAAGASARPAVVVLKGAALATTLYANIALRPLSDVDLLVPRQHLEAAVRAVQSLGYREGHPEMSPGINRLAGHHVGLRGGPRCSVSVELHWSLVGGDNDWRSPSLDWFWEQAESWAPEAEDFGLSQSAFQLSPTAHLLYLAAHLMLQHGGAQARLLWLYDLHLLINRWGSRLDWDELLRRAHEFRWSAALHAALERTRDCLGSPVPAEVLEAVGRAGDREAQRLVARKAGGLQTRSVGTWHALAALDWRSRLRLAWGITCPSPVYMRWRYRPCPAWLWPLSYPYRWLDMLGDGLGTLARLAQQSSTRAAAPRVRTGFPGDDQGMTSRGGV